VDQGNSNFDFELEEIERRMTIATSVGWLEWKKRKLNLLDTPGDGNFIYDTRFSMSAADTAVVVVSAPDGVEVQTERVWDRAKELGMARVIFVNKMDRERADPDRVLEEIRSTLSGDAIAVQVPVGKEASFQGVVDVISGKFLKFTGDGSGQFTQENPPADLAQKLAKAREALMEKIAESDDKLLNKYLEAGELSQEEIFHGFVSALKKGLLYPVFFGSAVKNMGVQPLMDLAADFAPAPDEMPPVKGAIPGQDGEATRGRSAQDPFLAFVFKTFDAQGGSLSIMRVLSGSVTNESVVLNVGKKEEERIGNLVAVIGKKQEQISQVSAGDIVGVMKLKATSTGDILCDKAAPFVYTTLELPPPAISYAIKPKSKGDEDKLGSALTRLLSEDPTLRVSRHEDTKDFLLSGMGAAHVEISVSRLKRRFGVDVQLEMPRVPYRETITRKAEAQGKHKRQTGGRGQYGDVWLELSPLARGKGFEFEDRIKGGVVPGQFIPAVEKGVIETMQKGVLAGFPVVDVKVALFDGSYHEVDSSEMAFKRAASIGFKAAMQKAGPILLEPIYNMEVVVPDDKMGDIIGDLNSRRGRVQGMENKGKRAVIKAQAPLAEILRYSPDLDSRTGGRGSFTMEFSHYQEVPAQIAEKVIAAYKSNAQEEEEE